MNYIPKTNSLAKRFVSDYNLPVKIFHDSDGELWRQLIDIYQDYDNCLDKWIYLCDAINEEYGGNKNKFLDDYYSIRDEVITSVLNNPAYIRFNEMDLNCFSVKDKPNVTSNNVYNCSNIGKSFLSIDLKKANFQALKHVDPEIVFNADTYEDFIERFTKSGYISGYIKESKYFRQVVFGKCNPKRHITVEKYLINKIYNEFKNEYENDCYKLVSMSNDEFVFEVNNDCYEGFLKFGTAGNDEKSIDNFIKERTGLITKTKFFRLKGYCLHTVNANENKPPFFVKEYADGSGDEIMCLPLNYFIIGYKLLKGKPLDDDDYCFSYDGVDCKFNDEFTLMEIDKDGKTEPMQTNLEETEISKPEGKNVYDKCVKGEKRVVFFGSGDFPVKTFEYMVDDLRYKVVGLVTSNDKVFFEDQRLVDIAKKNGIPYYIPTDLKDEKFLNWLEELKGEIFCVISYKYLPKEVLSKCIGNFSFNVHASILPLLKGANPITWAIRLGFKNTGVTAIRLSDKIDEGDIIYNLDADIDENETYGTLYERLSSICVDVAEKVVIDRFSKWYVKSVQQPKIPVEYKNMSIFNAPKNTNEDACTTLGMWSAFEHPAYELNRYIRAYVPHMGVSLKMKITDENRNYVREINFKVYETELIYPDLHSTLNGNIITDWKTRLYMKVPLYEGFDKQVISIKKIQLTGKKILDVKEFLKGFQNFKKEGYSYNVI